MLFSMPVREVWEIQFLCTFSNIIIVFYFSCSNKYVVVSHCNFNLQYLMANDVDCLFMCISFICISYLVKCLFMSFAHFVIRFFLVLLLLDLRVPYIFYVLVLCLICDLQIFPPCSLPFHFLNWIFHSTKSLYFWWGPIYFFFYGLCFWHHSNNL